MKDIIIPGKRIKKELLILLYCYIVANLVNAFSIVYYKTEWVEMITWQRFVLLIAFLFYLVTVIFRLIFSLFRKKV